MQKKLAASILASFALASCVPSKNAEVSAPAQPQPPVPTETTQTVAAPTETPVATETGASAMPATATGMDAMPGMESSTGTASTGSVSDSGTVSEVRFESPYDLGGGPIPFSGKIVLKNGVIASVEVDNAKGPQEAFAKGVNSQVAGKPLKGLQIDTVSGASGTSKAFNAFLSKQQ